MGVGLISVAGMFRGVILACGSMQNYGVCSGLDRF
jgi:hypothetical protein